jgi:hypothetical protein
VVITEAVEQLLEREGWTICCFSPLEVSHEDGSFASGQAATYTIEGVVADAE